MTNSYGTGSKITEYENNGMFCSETFQSDKGHATAWKSTHGIMQEKTRKNQMELLEIKKNTTSEMKRFLIGLTANYCKEKATRKHAD